MHIIPKRATFSEVDTVAGCQLRPQFGPHALQPSAKTLVPTIRGLELGSHEAGCGFTEKVDLDSVVIAPEMNLAIIVGIFPVKMPCV